MAGPTYELNGQIKLISDQQTFPSGFTKREFVVTTDENYPQDVKIECIKDRCSLLDGMAVGDKVSVNFNIRGNEYKDRYYVNLQAWRMSKQDADTAPAEGAAPAGSMADAADLVDDVDDIPEGDDNVPF